MWNLNDLKQIEYESGYSFLAVLDDNTSAVIDFSDYLQRGPVFEPLRDLSRSSDRQESRAALSLGSTARTLPLKPSMRSAKN